MLVKGADGLTTLIVFLGVFGGLAAFGLLGIFIARWRWRSPSPSWR